MMDLSLCKQRVMSDEVQLSKSLCVFCIDALVGMYYYGTCCDACLVSQSTLFCLACTFIQWNSDRLGLYVCMCWVWLWIQKVSLCGVAACPGPAIEGYQQFRNQYKGYEAPPPYNTYWVCVWFTDLCPIALYMSHLAIHIRLKFN